MLKRYSDYSTANKMKHLHNSNEVIYVHAYNFLQSIIQEKGKCKLLNNVAYYYSQEFTTLGSQIP